ncbi:MAG: precorrin-4 C(11)-methyltransferase [Chloroflexi bacterium]|nr:precorrin-4 C(11)-methyltransferase [Chloroflexota bacterium]
MKVYFIGAGPGDPGLVTLKAKQAIEEADVIIYAGSLVNPELLRWAKAGAAVHNSAGMTFEQVTGVIARAYAEGKTVARLHTGDITLYSAIQEQIGWCVENSVPYQVIPGVSSYSAACATLGQELTLPGISQTVVLTRIGGRTDGPEGLELRALAGTKATLVLFLSAQHIDRVVAELSEACGPDMPVAVVQKASWPEEKVITGTLRDIADKVKQAGMDKTAIIIIGEVLNKRGERSRLYDKSFGHAFRSAG